MIQNKVRFENIEAPPGIPRAAPLSYGRQRRASRDSFQYNVVVLVVIGRSGICPSELQQEAAPKHSPILWSPDLPPTGRRRTTRTLPTAGVPHLRQPK
jgi:hypothetical protein